MASQDTGPWPDNLFRPCHCLCGRAHPGDPGICEAKNAVITRRFTSELTGPVDVPLCAPCAVAQGLTELHDAGQA